MDYKRQEIYKLELVLCSGLKCLHAGHLRRSFDLGLGLQKLLCNSRLGLATDAKG